MTPTSRLIVPTKPGLGVSVTRPVELTVAVPPVMVVLKVGPVPLEPVVPGLSPPATI